MAFLRLIDIFGTTFQFTIFNNSQYKTNVGGFFSLTCLALALLLLGLFGRDLLYHDTPKVGVDYVVSENYPRIKHLSQDLFLVAWRIAPHDSDDTLNYNDYLYASVTNFFTNGTNKQYSRNLEIANCAELNITNESFNRYYNASNFNCLDLRNTVLPFGGNPDDDDFYSTWRIQILPRQGQTNMNQLLETIGSNAIIQILYPDFYYSSSSEVPLGSDYVLRDQRINIGLRKKDRFYIQNITCIDDQGWLFKDPKPSHQLSVGDMKNEYDYFTMDYFITDKIPFYECIFYLDRTSMTYSRSFMKVQDLAAQVTGVINFIILVFKILTFNYNIYNRNQYLFNEIFEYKDLKNLRPPKYLNNLTLVKKLKIFNLSQ
jgi:hypothetical protein